MGQLDDAIREHLELKRRRGADPTEVAREEQDALGPVRRETERRLPAEPDLPALDEEEWDDEEPGSDPAEHVTRLHRVESGEEEDLVDEAAAEPESGSPAAGRRIEPNENFEWDSDERPDEPEPQPEAAAPPGEEDVLEETPEFLQETPEHDRLWFEQRPPRDFDWDK